MKKIILKAEKKLASDSPDHLEPFGTRRDNTRNRIFNKKLYNIWSNSKQLKVLDLGCSGGGFIKDCIDEGHFGIGIDGSDYSKKIKRAEWGTIPKNLFICDITKKFKFLINKKPLLFDVITLWDVIEHIKEEDLETVFNNLKSNINDNGIIILSVGCEDDIVNGYKLHQTVKPRSWWLNEFDKNNLRVAYGYKEYFRNQWVKGRYNYKSGFNIVLTKKDNYIPVLPKQKLYEKLFDIWADSKLQIILRRIIFGYIK